MFHLSCGFVEPQEVSYLFMTAIIMVVNLFIELGRTGGGRY